MSFVKPKPIAAMTCFFILIVFALATFPLFSHSQTALNEPSTSLQSDDSDWIQLFNGKDLEGWTAKIVGHDLGDNYADTFRVEDGLLTVSYADYVDEDFKGGFKKFGHLFHKDEFSHYRLRVEYRFIGDQCPNGPGWAFRNNGLMLHGQNPETMDRNQDFPVSIEVQLLGGDGNNPRSNLNLCTPGTNVVLNGKLFLPHCTNSSAPTFHGDQWVTAEVEVLGGQRIRHIINGDVVMEYSDPQYDPRDANAKKLIKGENLIIEKGSISIQSESHPTQFRKIELLPLEPKQEDQTKQSDQADQANQVASQPRLGIATTPPDEGKFVALEDGTFMVPYTFKIPGTEIEFTMIPIPGGKFLMGSPESESDRNDDEGPQVEVSVEPFWMGKHEVTWAEYKSYMQLDKVFMKLHEANLRVVDTPDSIDALTAPSSLYDTSFTYGAGEEPDQPAATMSQFAAKQYTKWLSLIADDFYRLPYEAEWEYACRAGTTTTWYFGDDESLLDEHAWYFDNADYERQTVGQKLPNPWGLYDMYGNVAEWVLDQHADTGYDHIEGESVTVEQSYRQPKNVEPRTLRGGGFLAGSEECRSASRKGSDGDWRMSDPNQPQSPWWYTEEDAEPVGFRLVRPLNNQLDRQQKEAFWKADHEQIMFEIKARLRKGQGRLGSADPELPNEIRELLKQ